MTPAHFNGIPVTRIGKDGDTILVPLPREAWVPLGDCACQYCTADRDKPAPAYWDTIAIGVAARGADTTATVHAPELHGAKAKR